MFKYEYLVEEIKNETLKSKMKNMHGSFIIKNGKIISRGYNDVFYTQKGMCIMHAEVNAIVNFIKRYSWELKLKSYSYKQRIKELQKSIMMVVRVNKKGNFLFSEPCENCKRMIKKYKIKQIYYSIDSE